MPITDLTGYTWVGNNLLTPVATSNQHIEYEYHINFISNNLELSYLLYTSDFDTEEFDYPQTFLTYDGEQEINGAYYEIGGSGSGLWQNEAYKTIVFTGGTDATNSTLIAWLEANGTLTAPSPQPTNKMFVGSLSIAKAFVGSNEVSSIWLGNNKLYEKGA